jgi:branched-chain amino acid transport system permease protein
VKEAAAGRVRVLGFSPLGLGAVAAGAAALLVLPPLYGQFLPQRLSDYLIFGMPALAVGLIAGHARLLNIGVGATFGVAAYTVAVLTQHSVLNPVVLMLAAIASGLLVSVLFAIYAVVATGLEYLLLTLLTTAAFASTPLIFQGLLGGENGLAAKGAVSISFGLDPLQGDGFYWLLCAVTLFWLGLSRYLLSSRAGKVMTAIGRNPTRAAAMGYSVHAYQIGVTFYAGAIAATGGWLYALERAFVFQDLLGIAYSLNSVVYSLIGGVESVVGPLLGTAGLRYLGEYLGQQSTQSQLYIGVALMLVVYLLPAGVIGAIQKAWRVRSRLRGSRAGLVETLGTVTGSQGDLDTVLGGTLDE